MPYVGKKPADIIATAVDTTTGNFSETLAVTGETTLSANLNLGDNDKAIFGAGDDLQIYHDTVNGNSVIHDAGSGNLRIRADDFQVTNAGATANLIFANDATGEVKLYHNGSEKLSTTSSGIQVTGNIANTSGDLTIDVAGDIILDADGEDIRLKNGGTEWGKLSDPNGDFGIQAIAQDRDIVFYGNDGGSVIEAMRIDMSASNVGIGTSSPSEKLEINSGVGNIGAKIVSTDSLAVIAFKDNSTTDVQYLGANGNNLVFAAGATPTERMRIDSNGNLLVDTTSAVVLNSGGFAVKPQGSGTRLDISNSGGTVMLIERRTNDGDIISFYKDNSSVGSIGVNTKLYIGGSGETHTTGVSFQGSGTSTNRSIAPSDGSGALVDGAINLGSSADRWNSLWLSGGVYLGGTGSANKLDDYEEGTWTPSLVGLSNTPSFHNNVGRYTKVGRVCTVQFFQQTNVAPTFSSGTAEFKVGGLPFTVDGSGYTGSQGTVNAQGFNYHASNNTQSTVGSGSDGGAYLTASVTTNEQMQFNVTASGATRGIVNNNGAAQGYIIEATVTYFTSD